MEGDIAVAFGRQPSYFAAAAVEGSLVQVGVALDRDSGRIIGMGSRAISLRHVNGQRIPIGYLSGLRLMKQHRGQAGLLARGYRFLRQLHEDRRVALYLTTIAVDNRSALNLLTSGRAGLPVYHPCGKFCTVSIAAIGRKAGFGLNGRCVDIRPAHAADRDAILQFLNWHGPSRQFFPVYTAGDLFSGNGLLQGLQPADVLLAYRNGEIVGTLACWDQRSSKQIVIHGYRRWLRPLRPLYNAWATLRRRPTLPAAGSVLPVSVAAIPIVRDDDPAVFEQLLEAARRRSAQQGATNLLLGLHEADPLLPIARRRSGREYPTNLYLVYWPDETPDVGKLNQRVPYLELGGL
jgi:hypothetical protein